LARIGANHSGISMNALVCAVSTRPGDIVLQRILCLPPSMATWRDIAMTPPLAAV